MAQQALNPVPIQTPMTARGGIVTLQWNNWFQQLLAQVKSGSLINPMSALGDLIFGGNQGAATRLPGNISTTKQFLTQTGLGTSSSQPTWGPLASADIPNNAANTTGSAASLTQSLAQFQLTMGEGVGAGIAPIGSIGTVGQVLTSGGPGIAPSWAADAGAFVIFGTRPTPILITASGGITTAAVQRQLIRIKGSGGAVTVTAGTPISPGTIDGQELILEGSSTSSTVTINNGTGLEWGGSMTLGTGDKVAFIWNLAAGVWTEEWRFFSGVTGADLTDDSGNPLTDNSGNPLTDG
jgi:hypothetical protein